MYVTLNYSFQEQKDVDAWKKSLPPNPAREYGYFFVYSGRHDKYNKNIKLYKHIIATNDEPSFHYEVSNEVKIG